MKETDVKYMERALRLARLGRGYATPNPMVGAVVVDRSGAIIGEGYHRCCGEAHAEVNAIAAVSDPSRLATSTIYVTLEPCSHYGKTPPCARLIIEKGIPRVVVGALDPFEKVSGRGVAMLREAGVEVEILDGEINRRCRELNEQFMTAHTLRRPYVALKWACSSDGFMDHRRTDADPLACRFSTPLSLTVMHRLRSQFDAIMVGSNTVEADDPRLDVRHWHGPSHRKVVVDRRGVLDPSKRIFADPSTIYITSRRRDDLPASVEQIIVAVDASPREMLDQLYARGITSVMVEGGAQLLNSFIDSGLWDVARVEEAPIELGEEGRIPAPRLAALPERVEKIGENRIFIFRNKQ